MISPFKESTCPFKSSFCFLRDLIVSLDISIKILESQEENLKSSVLHIRSQRVVVLHMA